MNAYILFPLWIHSASWIRTEALNQRHFVVSQRVDLLMNTQGPEMCLWSEHQNTSKTSEKWVILIALQFRYTFYRPQTKRLRARKIGLQYRILLLGTSCLGRPLGNRLRSPFGRRSVRQRGYGLWLLIFKMTNNKVDLGQIRSEEIGHIRFIKIPLG